jgi:hypothetical protein
MASPWQWDRDTRRYRDTRTGRFLSPSAMVRLRDEFAGAMAEKGKAATEKLAEGARTLQQWTADQRQALKTAYIDQYVMGRGGRQQMTQSDWGRLGQMLRSQYSYLNGFSADLAAGTLTPAQAVARGVLYFSSSVQAYEAGKGAAWGITLPAHPGDGSTECKSNCRCVWVIVETDTAVEASWETRPAEHCETCVSRASTWAPLVFPRVGVPA